MLNTTIEGMECASIEIRHNSFSTICYNELPAGNRTTITITIPTPSNTWLRLSCQDPLQDSDFRTCVDDKKTEPQPGLGDFKMYGTANERQSFG